MDSEQRLREVWFGTDEEDGILDKFTAAVHRAIQGARRNDSTPAFPEIALIKYVSDQAAEAVMRVGEKVYPELTALATPDAAPRSADASPDYAQALTKQELLDLIPMLVAQANADGFKAGVEAAASEIEDSAIGLTGPGSDDLRAFIAKQVEIVYCLLASPSIPECGACGGSGVGESSREHYPNGLIKRVGYSMCPDCQGGE